MIGSREFYKQIKERTGVPEKYIKKVFAVIGDIMTENYKSGHTTKITGGIYFKPKVHHNTVVNKTPKGKIRMTDVVVPKIHLSDDFKRNFREDIKE